MKIRWSALGKPKTPGTYNVRGLGNVTVDQDIIDVVAQFDHDVFVSLARFDPIGHAPVYQITMVDPGPDR